MTDKIKLVFDRLATFGESRSGKRLIRLGKYLIQVGIVIILVYQIMGIGWREILSELPAVFLFYIIFLLIYFALPVTEYLTYSIRWPMKFWQSQEIFLKKRVYNKVVLGYSGEVQLFFWLQKRMAIDKKEAYEVVRDNNILSTLASTAIAVLLLAGFTVSGRLSIYDWVEYDPAVLIPVVLIALFIGGYIFGRYRSHIFTMNRRHALIIFTLHSGRMLLLAGLQIAQWYVVMPWVSVDIWFTMIVMQIILSRIPFLPNKDLVFIGTSLEFARHVDISVAGLAGLLLVNQVLDKLMNMVVFAFLSIRERRYDASRKDRNTPDND